MKFESKMEIITKVIYFDVRIPKSWGINRMMQTHSNLILLTLFINQERLIRLLGLWNSKKRKFLMTFTSEKPFEFLAKLPEVLNVGSLCLCA